MNTTTKNNNSCTIFVLGGYGNAGRPVTSLLLQYAPVHVDLKLAIAGRHLDKAQAWVRELAKQDEASRDVLPSSAMDLKARVFAYQVDASDESSLCQAFQETKADMVLIASSTSDFVGQVARAALKANIDYFDIQFSSRKTKMLQSMKDDIEKSGRCFITDGGFHPGLVAALIRYMATSFFETVDSAQVGGVIHLDWKGLEGMRVETMEEFAGEFANMEMLEYKNGVWKDVGMQAMLSPKIIDFHEPFGKQYCVPMFLEEMRRIPEMVPGISETGFYVAGLNWFVDYFVSPFALLALKIAPKRGKRPIGRFLYWGLRTFSAPPYGTRLKVDCRGIGKDGSMMEKSLTVSHSDGYVLTAIPVVATLMQMFPPPPNDAKTHKTIRKPGLYFQAQVVEPIRFVHYLEVMGVEIRNHPYQK